MPTKRDRQPGFDRRGFLTLGAGAVLVSALAGLPVRMARAQEPNVHRFTHGEFEITVLSDGFVTMPISNLAPDANSNDLNKLLETHNLPTDEHVSHINVVAIKTSTDLVLIDVGAGLNFVASAGLLSDSFEAAGLDPSDVTKVVLTHAHPDHIWGLIDDFDESARFNNADYFMNAREWDFWMRDDVLTKLPEELHGFALGAQRNLKPIADRIQRIGDNAAVASGVTMFDTPGHTPGHMSVMIESNNALLVATGDAVTHKAVSFERPEWRFIRDYDAETAIATRKKLLGMIAADKMRLMGYHLPWPGIGIVEAKDGSWRYLEASA